MKIFGLHILTTQQLLDHDANAWKDGFEDCKNATSYTVLPILEHLKKDHWDKDLCDRAINLVRCERCKE